MTSDSLSVMYVCSGILRSFTNVCREKNHLETKSTLQLQIIHNIKMCFIHPWGPWPSGDRLTNSPLRTLRYRKVICNWPYSHGKLIHQHIKTLMRLSCYARFVAAFTGSLNVQVEVEAEEADNAPPACWSIRMHFKQINTGPLRSYSLDSEWTKITEGERMKILSYAD